jgi:hypothetical protein
MTSVKVRQRTPMKDQMLKAIDEIGRNPLCSG